MSDSMAITGVGETVNLSEADLMAQAQQQSGLSDWGEDNFRAGLQILLAACANEANLSTQGQQWLQHDMLHWLTNRLQIQATFKASPEILDVPIERPLFILGLPRTGSTLLHRLLAQDENGRVPVLWELSRPAPPPRPETRATDPRIAQVADEIERTIQRLIPDMATKHSIDVQAPEECNSLFQDSFACYATGVFYHVPTYLAWLRQQDLTAAYQYYKTQVQILTYHYPGRTWISKNPDHMLGIDAILKVFPDAAIVYLHRDLSEVFGSVCSVQHSLLNMWRKTPFAAKDIGNITLNMLAPTVDRALLERKQANPAHFYDLHYTELTADPVGAVERIYDYFGYALSPASSAQMQSWLAQNKQNKHGEHHYKLEDFGLTLGAVQERLADYLKEFP
ncbi:MAG: sulfotransferase [Chloroflexi bacterium]|nr:sulfotransferase [Chloroflexota bacterium]